MPRQKQNEKKRLQAQLIRFVLLACLFAGGTYSFMKMLERVLLNQVQAVSESANVAATRLFVNEAWSELDTKLDMTGKVAPKDNPQLSDVDMRVRRFAKGTDFIKVKIYNTQGLTIYSSDPAQLGEDKSNNAGFQTAARGRVASETTYRGKFGAFDGELYERNLVSSYVPVRGAQGIDAVVEVYADRTSSIDLVEKTIRETWILFGFSSFAIFVLVWLLAQSGRRQIAISDSAASASDEHDSNQSTDLARTSNLIERAITHAKDSKEKTLSSLKDEVGDLGALKSSELIREFADSSMSTLEEIKLILNPKSHQPASSGRTLSIAETAEALSAQTANRLATVGIDLSLQVTPALASEVLANSTHVLELLKLLIKDAATRLGSGHIRLNLQPYPKQGVLIELICTRTPSMQEPVTCPVFPSHSFL